MNEGDSFGESSSLPVTRYVLNKGEKLTAGQVLKSRNGKFSSGIDASSGFLVTRYRDAVIIWNVNEKIDRIELSDEDGNLVFYDAADRKLFETTKNSTNGGAEFLILDNDGLLKAFDENSQILWALGYALSKPLLKLLFY